MKWLVAKIFALESRDDTSAVAVIAAISGFLVGIAYSTWHVVLESAQIIAGIVEHSLELPNYLFLLKAWNLLNQGAAIFLKAGLLEKPICIVISGLLGMVSFLALSLATYAMCKNAFVAVGMPFFIQFTHAAQFGIQYPLVILGIWSSYGAFSFGFNLLVISLISLKKYRAGGFLLGIAPGIHVVTGGFLWIVLLVVLFWDFKNHWELFKKTVKSFLAGVTFSAISFLTHTALFGFIWGQGGGDAEILDAYLRHWDFHRAPVNLLSVNFIIGIYSLAVCLMGVFFFKRNQGVSGDSLFQLQALSIFGILGLLASLISHLPHELIPTGLLNLMPTKLWNVAILGFFPVLVGLMVSFRENVKVQSILAAMLLSLFFILWLHPDYWGRMLVVILFISIGGLLFVKFRESASEERAAGGCLPVITNAAIAAVLVSALLGTAVNSAASWKVRKNAFNYWANDAFFAEISSRKGLLLVTHFGFPLQLITRRPAVAGAIDALPYAPRAASFLHEFLKNVYGFDILEPNVQIIKTESVPYKQVRVYWESRTLEQWQAIKDRYGITDVLTFTHWKLQLPAKPYPGGRLRFPRGTTREEFSLFSIP